MSTLHVIIVECIYDLITNHNKNIFVYFVYLFILFGFSIGIFTFWSATLGNTYTAEIIQCTRCVKFHVKVHSICESHIWDPNFMKEENVILHRIIFPHIDTAISGGCCDLFFIF